MRSSSPRVALALALFLSFSGAATSSAQEVEVIIETARRQSPQSRPQRQRLSAMERWDQALAEQAPLRFTGRTFRGHQQNARGLPRAQGGRQNTQLVLLNARNRFAASAAFLPGDLSPPYAVDFEFRSDQGRAARPTPLGEGIVLMLQRDRRAYGVPPTGADRGFVADGSGYGVHLDPVAGEVVLTDGRRRILATRQGVQLPGGWHRLRVLVLRNQIRVFLDGEPVIRMRGPVDASFGALGFAAGNGQSSGTQVIRDVRVVAGPLSRPQPPATRPVRTGRLHELLNGSFEQPRIANGTHQLFDSIPGWSLASGSAIEVQRGVAGPSSHGRQHVELDSQGSIAIYQDIRTRPATVYEVSFDFAPRPGTPTRDNRVAIFWEGQQVTTAEANGRGQRAAGWNTYTFQVRSSANVSRLEFRDVGVSNNLGGYLDNVTIRRAGR